MAVEEYRCLWPQEGEEGYAGGELVDEEARRVYLGEFRGEESNRQDEVDLAEDGAEDGEAAEDGRGDDGVASYADVEGSCLHITIISILSVR